MKSEGWAGTKVSVGGPSRRQGNRPALNGGWAQGGRVEFNSGFIL